LDCSQWNAGYGEKNALDGRPKADKYKSPEADDLEVWTWKNTAVLKKKADFDNVHSKIVAEDGAEKALCITH
jgi:hypothetical protein